MTIKLASSLPDDIEDMPDFASQSPTSVVNEPSLSQSEEASNLMGPFDPSSAGEETIADIDTMSTKNEFSNKNDFFHHQAQTAWQHFLMAVMDMTKNMESRVHTPAHIAEKKTHHHQQFCWKCGGLLGYSLRP